MIRKAMCLLILAVVCLSCVSMLAQDNAARTRLIIARAQYYTPTAKGLKSFSCDAAIDWKAMLTRFGGAEIPEDSPVLKYLRGVRLSVVDQLRGKGSLEWMETDAPPEGKQQSVKQMREGLQTMMGGFFQTWNAYMNGSMVPFPDTTVTVTAAGDGIHMRSESASMKVDEDFDKTLLLTQVVVETPELKVVAIPTYLRTDDGLLVSAVASQISQPPSAAPMEVSIHLEYTKVDSFQLPSHIVNDIKNIGLIEIDFSACRASVADATPEPAAGKSGNP